MYMYMSNITTGHICIYIYAYIYILSYAVIECLGVSWAVTSCRRLSQAVAGCHNVSMTRMRLSCAVIPVAGAARYGAWQPNDSPP